MRTVAPATALPWGSSTRPLILAGPAYSGASQSTARQTKVARVDMAYREAERAVWSRERMDSACISIAGSFTPMASAFPI